jgi:tryptophan 2,3-dioxygenase
MALTYSDYLKVDQLLSLQRPQSAGPEHDEMLFIIIHQVYELWFKEVLHEVDHLGRLLRDGDLPRIGHTMKRILTIFKTMVGQVDVLETLTPLEFLSFRSNLESASGFQSHQFRALEAALGKKDPDVPERFPDGSAAREMLEQRHANPGLWDAFLVYLAGEGLAVPEKDLQRRVSRSVEPSPALQRLLLEVYRDRPAVAAVCDLLLDLDEGLQEWRYRHVKMVERTIGARSGTGGSSGVGYLASTLFKPLFPDLWAIRSEL